MRIPLALLALAACSDATLTRLPEPEQPPVDDSLRLTGELCTESPDELDFPSRVIFLVDASESMRVSDPADPTTGVTQRERAIEEASERLLSSPDARVSLVRFSAQTQPLTRLTEEDGSLISYFTADLPVIVSQLPLLAATDRTTNFLGALSEAYSQIRDEVSRTAEEAWPRARFDVVLVSDGLPDAESGEHANIFEAVEDLTDLTQLYRLEAVTLSTAHLETGNLAVDRAAGDLLREMAEVGGGSFHSFAHGSRLDFIDVAPERLVRTYTLSDLVVWNLNARPLTDGFAGDADADGLSDLTEALESTDPFSPDSDGDGCRDSIELAHTASGLSPLDPTDCRCFTPEWCFDQDMDGICDNGCTDADGDQLCDCTDLDEDGRCDPSNYEDRDHDGLVDCEERWTGTNPLSADTDRDGLLDLHEFLAGTRPDVADREDDADWDRVSDGDEVRTGTDPLDAEGIDRFSHAYRYRLEDLGWQQGRSCHAFDISNITLVDLVNTPETLPTPATWPLGQGFSGFNRVLLIAAQVPMDNPEAPARHRVACVEAAVDTARNARNPPSGRSALTHEDFVPLSSFDPALHCRRPGSTP